MAIRFNCGHCNATYSVSDKFAGQAAKCKKCQQKMRIPTLPQAGADGVVELPAAKIRAESRVVTPAAAQLQNAPVVAIPIAAGHVRPAAPPAKVIPVAASIPLASSGPLESSGPLPSSGDPLVPGLTSAELLRAITGKIQPVPTSISYRIAAFALACLMILLPLIYVGLIGLAMAGVWWYAIHGTSIFEGGTRASGRGGFALVLLYVGPLVIGALTVLFMIKPLFARSARSDRRRSLRREAEPKLFAFVDKLCESVHAPKPKRIDVDCEVNASASFRNGMLSLFVPNDLVLTIGMPLVAGLTARQLGGVLAHEFGHFSQGFGMRVSYIVRTISYWFARVVYERDRWDEWLASAAHSLDFRIGIVLHFARLMIWLTRRILWCLMMVGQIFSCYLLRQMEFDADLHETRFAGSDDFRKTSMQLRRLGIAYQQSLADQQGFFMNGKLGNDLPKLVQLNRDAQDDELVRKIFAGVMEEKTEWLTTHPVDKDRVARAKAAKEPGVFQLEAPASVLFERYAETCEAVTRDTFKEAFGDELKPSMLVPVEQLVQHKTAALEANLAMRRMFGNHFSVPRHMVFQLSRDTSETCQTLHSRLLSARTAMIKLLPEYASQSKAFDALDSRWLMCHQVRALLELGLKLKQADFQVPVQSAAAAATAGDECRAQLAVMHQELRPLESAFEQRVAAAGGLLLGASADAATLENLSDEERTELREQLHAICETLPEIDKAYGESVRLRNEYASLALMLQAVGGQELAADAAQKIMAKIEQLALAMRAMSERFQMVHFPFEHADGRLSLSQYLLPKLPAKDDVAEVVGGAERFVENYHYVYFRSIGALAHICQRIEGALGFEPQPVAPHEEKSSEEIGAAVV